jgi:large subunit ribosomal protein L30
VDKKVEITQVRSVVGRPKRQRATMQALGLGKMHKSVVKGHTPQIEGMINKVSHLVSVKEL